MVVGSIDSGGTVDRVHALGLAGMMADHLARSPEVALAGLRLDVGAARRVLAQAERYCAPPSLFRQPGDAGDCEWCGWPQGAHEPIEDGEYLARVRCEKDAARLTLAAVEMALTRFIADGAEDTLRLSWVESLAREIVRNPAQAEADIRMMAQDASPATAAGVGRARWLAAAWQRQAGPQPLQAVHPMISNGAAAHTMLSTPGIRQALGVHGAAQQQPGAREVTRPAATARSPAA